MAEGNKTEKATPKKRRDERKRGHVSMSRDVVGIATLIGAFAALRLVSGSIVNNLTMFMRHTLNFGAERIQAGNELQGMVDELGLQAIMVLLKTVGVIAAVVIICAVVSTFAQTRFLVAGESIKPKLSKINPLQGVKRLFSLKSIIETLKNILKIIILLIVIYMCLKNMYLGISRYLYADVRTGAVTIFTTAMNMILWIILAFAVLAGFDFMYQRWDFEREMKMTKQEVKEEFKQIEGNPQIKGKIREMQHRMARTRMMQQVPQADVVIRNPTHFAVALRYKPETDNAPVVLALGRDELALRIVKTAEENNVAVIENPPLARSLYASCELGQEIAPELYGAVAEVLVYIFRINNDNRIKRKTNQ